MSVPTLFPEDLPIRLAGLSYVPSFVTPAEQQFLIDAIDTHPWGSELRRRVQHYGHRYDYKSRRLDPSTYLGPLPPFVAYLLPRLEGYAASGQWPDQLIVNEYQPGQGISAHVDCEPCFTSHIASVSLGSACEIEFRHRSSDRVLKLTLAAGSLLVMADEARYDWTHQIRPRFRDNGVPRRRRISLTFRKVILAA